MKPKLDSFLSARILVVDDQVANVRLLERLLEHWGYTQVASTTNSAEVMQLCAAFEPDLLLLDLQMPAPDGFDLLAELNELDDRAFLPVLVLTADVSRESRERALTLGASDFLSKPFDPTEVRLRIGNLLELRRLNYELRDQNAALAERVEQRTRALDLARLETLERLALAAEYRDDNTHEHAQRVGRASAEMARRLGWSDEELELLRRAAPLHDIGKIGIPDAILLKPGALTPEEFAVMQTHTTVGREILAGSGSRVLQMSAEIALTHHERWNGSGYPLGLAGAEIPLTGRLVAVADVFDALTHDRPYKSAWPVDAALVEMRLVAGTHLDPELVELFGTLDHELLMASIPAADEPLLSRALA